MSLSSEAKFSSAFLFLTSFLSKTWNHKIKVTMVSSGGGEIGAAKLTGEVLDVVRRLPAVVEAMTGVQLMPMK